MVTLSDCGNTIRPSEDEILRMYEQLKGNEDKMKKREDREDRFERGCEIEARLKSMSRVRRAKWSR